MHIRTLKISGFGHFHDFIIDDIPPGFVLFEGANEAGKTTLLAFIRAGLFGFPDRRSNLPRYEPLHGGAHGGSLVFEDNTGEVYRIERRPGTARGEVTIYYRDEVWHGEARVKDLLKGMSEHLFQQIFCFGLDELQRLETLDNAEVSGLIYSAGMGYKTRSYPQMQKSLTDALGNLYKASGRKPEINQLLKELAELDEEIYRAEQIPEEYNLLKKELQELTVTINDLDRRQVQSEEKENWLKALQRVSEPFCQLKHIEAEIRQLPEIDTFPEEGVARLEGYLLKILDTETALKRLEAELEGCERELVERKSDEGMLAAGPEIQELYTGVRFFQERLKEREQQEIQVAQRSLEVQHCLQELGPGWNPERIQGFPVTLIRREQIREFFNRQKNLEVEKKSLDQEYRQSILWKEEREGEYTVKEREFNRLQAAGGTRSAGSKVWLLTLGISSIFLAGGGWLLLGKDYFPGIILTITALVLCGTGSYISRLIRATGQEQLRTVEAELEERRSALNRADSQQANIERRLRSYEEDKAGYIRDWRSFLAEDQLPGNLKPEDVLDICKLIEQGKEILRRYDEALTNRDHNLADLEEFTVRTNQILGTLGRPAVRTEQVVQVIYHLQEEYVLQKDNQERAAVLAEQCRGLKRDKSVIEHQRVQFRAALTGLINEGKASSEEDFRLKNQIYHRRQELIRAMLEWETAFEMAAAANVEELKNALETCGIAGLAENLNNVQRERQELKDQLDEFRQKQGRIAARLEQLETSEEISAGRQRRESIVDEIKSRAEEWMVLSLSQTLLEAAKERYERERQPGVLREASEYFSELTGGRYDRVLRSLEENRLEVLRADGRRLATTALSRGTAEQLYLAMRFALVKEYGRRSLPMPVIMDDILVNFDTERTKQALRVMARLAEENQILFFTCHSHLIPLMKQVGISYKHFQLTQSGLKRF